MHRRLSFQASWMWGMLCCILLLSACGNGEYSDVQDPKEDKVVFSPDTSAQIPQAQMEEWVAERRAKGDTFAQLPTVMESSILKTIPGYELEIDEAELFETKRFTFSEATKVFYNKEGDFVEIVAGDYVANPEFFEVALQRYNLAQGVELEGLTDRKLELDCGGGKPCFAWESYSAPKSLAQANLVLEYRYFISVASTGRSGFISKADLLSWINLSVFGN